ncbi:energy transducer TonB [Devosia alba]|uniref:energy transducer TonB n=1 Tax=Devosia alba TaxID=3152360 RepID=UPI00326442BA
MNFVFPIHAHETVGSEKLHVWSWGEVLLWASAALIVLSASIVLVTVTSNWRTAQALPGAPPPAIMIELAEIAVAPPVEDIAADEGELSAQQQPVQAAAANPQAATPVEPLQPEPLPEQVSSPVNSVTPTPIEPLDAVAPVVPKQRLEPVVAETIEELVPDLLEADAEVAVPIPVALPASVTEQRKRFAEQLARRQRQREQQPQVASAQRAPRSVEAQPSPRTAAPQQTETTRAAPSISPQQWQSQIVAHLNRAKRYPNDARNRREEGAPHLQFTIDRAGQVVSARIVRSSGFRALDEAALEMISRASPVPPPPAEIGGRSIMLTVPVNFDLR